MITGFNTEVKYKDITFHVQTEDRGSKVARIDTVIYKSGGAVLHRKKVFYKDIVKCECLEQVVRELMSEIHNRTTKEIQKGLWAHGRKGVNGKNLDEILKNYLLSPMEITGLK